MSGLKVVVCATQQEAETEKQTLILNGFQVRNGDPTKYDDCVWDATVAGGSAEGRSNVWVVIGES